ncbi:GntR family transcriptional regulator [Actinopolymorpha pittospori]|uniref:DNA-binding GntR family transcriptional regulator n=1 Tax=Actinopolymorpha pittospori TaxID=648752 RepID=A0A927MP20_9ACTN|nr:GntR family transcriptional regulator [Actinopolymorpha pittospori]MBE1603776.1 DNA-binding GntR family transcriptional regulator [Actinopolymorpha pittospori]
MGPDDKVVHDAPLPPYRQLAEILRARVQRGDWLPNKPLPSELQLAGTYDVARGTVRRAIGLLIEDGILFTVPHRGTYVSERGHRKEAPTP